MSVELIVLLAFAALAVAGVIFTTVRRRRALPERSERALPGETPQAPEPSAPPETPEPSAEAPAAEAPPRFRPPPLPGAAPTDDRAKLRSGLAKTRQGFVSRLARLFRGRPTVDDDLRDSIEEVLFTADIGPAAAQRLLDQVTDALDRRAVTDADALWNAIRSATKDILDIPAPPLDPDPPIKPYVLLMIGVNGVGKTTTLGKLAARHRDAGRSVLLVAGDTFRAAAVEQLEVWAKRVGCGFHHGADKADPSSVIFDGITRARKEGFDVVLCDTAGRLHTRKELMDELSKVRRAAVKALARDLPPGQQAALTDPHDTFLVLDATIGQNALAQARLFKETMNFTGLVVTKLDGTAKGGVVLGICDEMKIPIRFIGIGEGIEDLRPFDPEAFVDALFAERDRMADAREPSNSPRDDAVAENPRV